MISVGGVAAACIEVVPLICTMSGDLSSVGVWRELGKAGR